MMRALYTAASGMKAGQTNVDTIANNYQTLIQMDLKRPEQNLNPCYIKQFRQRLPLQMVIRSQWELR